MRVDLLKHNQEAYEKIKVAIDEGKRKFAVSHATGTGKSYLIIKLCEDYFNDKKLVLVPSRYISEQIQKLFVKYDIENVDILLYQKLIKMSDEDITAMDYQIIVLDEYHHDAATKVWGEKVKLLIDSHSESIIFGTSATPIKTGGVNAIDELFEGNCVSELPLSECIAKKIVPLPVYVGALYNLDDELERLRKKVEASTNSKEEKDEFYKKINAMRSQIEKSYGMPIILNKHIKDKKGKYIVFCKNKKHLEEIKDIVIEWFRTAGFKDINSYVVHSSYEGKDTEYKAFCEDTSNSLKLLFCVNMLNEGLHLENISGVLLLRPTNSNIVWHQQIGRCIEANNTKNPVIIDAVNNFSSVGQGMGLLKEIKDAVAKEKEGNPEFDDNDFVDIDTFFVLENVLEIQEMFKEIEGRLQGNWENGLKHFDKYVREHNGDVLVPLRYRDEDGFPTGHWVGNRREEFKNGLLNKNRINKLNKRDFVWDVKKYEFLSNVDNVKRFIEENTRMPSQVSKDKYEKSLGVFLASERIKHRELEKYPKWRKEIMETIKGFSWNPIQDYFLKGCKYYKEYIKKSASSYIPNGYKTEDGFNLSSWVSSQKNKYRENRLPDNQRIVLEKIGFVFSENNDNFDKKFNLLIEYMEINHCNSKDIPQKIIYKGEQIGRFVSSMRAAYKNKSISKYRKEKLQSIGFIWSVFDQQWEDNLEWLKKYKDNHNGSINIPKSNKTLKHYYEWLVEQRRLYNKGQMREDRKKLFEEVIIN